MRKEFKTYEEQFQILKDKGLIVDENTIDILKRNNYYFLINRYKNIFILENSKPNIFRKGTTFNEIVALYDFDRELRMILLKYIITIENTLKSVISYEFSKKYGYNYCDEKSFASTDNQYYKKKELRDLFSSIKSTIAKSNYKHIKYYNEKYSEIPFWVVINNLSFGLVLKFFKLLKEEDKRCIAREFNISSEEFFKYLQVLHFYRNLAAHNQRTFDEVFNIGISRTKYHEYLDLENQNFSNITTVIIILKTILEEKDFCNMLNELKESLILLKNSVDTIDLKLITTKMGFNKKMEDLILYEKGCL